MDEQDRKTDTGSVRRVPTDSYAAIPSEVQQVPPQDVTPPDVVTLTRAEYEELLVDRERVSTYKHIQKVEFYLHKIIRHLIKRAESHDRSKLEEPEASMFALCELKLKDLEYGSAEYQESLEELKPALDHHYANNRHHPEHFKNSIEDMNLLDVLEMFCDWKASSERQNGGNLRKSDRKSVV